MTGRYGERRLYGQAEAVEALLHATGVRYDDRPDRPRLPPPGALMSEIRAGVFVMIDEADWHKVANYRWFPKPMGGRGGKVYAAATVQTPDGPRHVLMHRLIVDCPRGLVVDHLNGDTLDNRQANLRICTRGENARNKGHDAPSMRGVQKRGDRWIARVTIGRRTMHVGTYDTLAEAQAAAAQARRDRYGSRTDLSEKSRKPPLSSRTIPL